ncbi:MAG TPA: efflux RND transporter permease subunit [Gemmatimonadaceae bacterium]|nr:efflux RND transporter permease subunit [Gemmatimonadaceae bacterium]
MKLVEFPVRNYQFTVVLFAMLAALGVSSWMSIPRGEDPPLDFPTFTVVAVYPGASPADLERLVVRDVEERLDALENVESIESHVLDGVATIQVEFEADEDPDERYDEVLREMTSLRPDLPPELTRFSVDKATTLDVAIAQLALVSETAPYHELDELADRLEDRLTAIPGVRTAERWGVPERRVEVALDLGRLSRLELAPARVLQAIAGESVDLPAGRVEAGARVFNVKTSGSYETPEEVAATVVAGSDGRLVRVRDVADVSWGYEDSTYRASYNGKRAVFVTVTQQDGQNISAVRDRVWAALDEYAAAMPAGVTLERGFDQARNVSKRLSRLGADFGIAIGLVLLTLLPLGLRAAGIVMLSIPLSLAIGVTLLHFTGFTINQLSIVGAVIALGLIVDDSIVVVENITRFLRQGHSRMDAAIEATKQIAVAVAGATATLILAFVPLLFLPGGPGMYIRSLPVAVVSTVIASLFVSLTIIPWLASLILRSDEPEGGNRFLHAFERSIHVTYAPLLDRALRRPRLALATAGAFVIAGAALVPLVGFSLFPKAETPQFYVNVTAPQGASIEATAAAARFADSVIRRRPEVKAVFASVGRDNPRIYYNVIPRRDNPAVAQLFVILEEYEPDHTPALLDTLRAELAAYPAAELELREFENGPPIDAPIALRVQGPDLDTLQALAARVEQVLSATEGTQYVNNPVRLQRTDLQLVIDRDKAGLLHIPTLEIDRTLRLGLAGVEAGVVREPDGDARDIVVRMAGYTRPEPETLDRLYVASNTGQLTPVRQIAGVRFSSDVAEIRRVDRERAVTVTSFVQTGYNTDRLTRGVLARLDAMSLPAGYRIVPAGEIESRQESFGGIGSAMIVAMFLTLAVLVLEFKTFRGTLIVASVIPLGVMGGIIALFLTGNTLSFTAMIGFVALIGIEIKTSILLVDFTNQLRERGTPLDEAIRKAGEVRFLPIVLTTLTAIGGLLPLALQGHALYAPLAWVIIGGLVSSTLLARIVTPVLYRMMPPAVEPSAARG